MTDKSSPADQTLSEWTPPKIWTWDKESGGRFANINRPISGATSEVPLSIGKHDLQLYSLGTPNGAKVTIMLEELLEAGISSADYDAWLINIASGDQFGSGFVEINPNSKIPALVDHSAKSDPQSVFESGAILMYLAEKFGKFMPSDPRKKTACLTWLFWQMGATPYLGGGFGHFYAYAPMKIQYPIDRFAMEVKRQMDVLDKHLASHEFFAGDELSIADFAIYPWYGGLARGLLYEAAEFLQVETYTHVLRWAKQLSERPGFQRGVLVNRPWDEKGLAERHSAADFGANTG